MFHVLKQFNLLRRLLVMTLSSLAVLSSASLIAAELTSADDVSNRLKQANPTLPINKVTRSRLKGFWEAELPGGQVLYVTEDGENFIVGDLFQITDTRFVNLAEEGRNEKRKALLATIDESEMLVYAPAKDEIKATVTVFTDIDCGFCRKLHKEIPELNRMGIAIRYLAYPRAGVPSESYDKIVSAWCADDPEKAMTQAKSGVDLEPRTCVNSVARQYRIGGDMGVTGTPALVYESGELRAGYMPAAQLAAALGIVN
ncbi:MAG: thiol:disulfide interchange protein DsbC [Candidatus Azotimanducaceae bacterium]|jgi:thiol:disulfide interchange protein DsbC